MVLFALWLAILASFTASTLAAGREYFYGRNGFSKLLVSNVETKQNCGCNGTWDPAVFSHLSESFGGNLAEAVLATREQIALGPISIGENAYTLSARFSKAYSFSAVSNATIWNTVIRDMLMVASHNRNHSIVTGDYINTISGTHTITITIYRDSSCHGVYQPCETKMVPTTVEDRHSPRKATPGLDWSDAEVVKRSNQLPTYNSSSFHEIIMANNTLPALLYLEDSGLIIDTATIQIDDNKLQSRQGCFNTYYDAYSVDGTWATYGNWLPISSCLYTNLSPNGGSVSFTWGFSMAYAQSFGWSASSIISALAPSFSFSITETYTNYNTYNCRVPGRSVGQLWFQNLNAYGYAYKQTCHNAGACGVSCGNKQGPNYTGAPGRGTKFGCSTGSKNVNCNAYNNFAL
ncbi:hypothetical protein NQ176_g4453 [Zarea fungicola]|uniref:Uncharacterized protein n=1 Tax=Zarea fungicola TaxID=93591 RepID=A0ACC1NDC3_9HYPO|nr:hypothetical protein NQ176_g4453 [Lecanicillium fungicola]